MVEVLGYTLPDAGLIDTEATTANWYFWQPDKTYLVLGQSNKAERSLHLGLVEKDGITVMQRPSGGESVILSAKTLVIGHRLISEKLENPQVYFKRINGSIIAGLASLGISDLGYHGISDITIGPKKILGSSIYRKRNLVFYHAVLNICEDINEIAKYLQHPPKEPDYRKGRKHEDFVTSLSEAGYSFTTSEIVAAIQKEFEKGV
jgi:lipoate-protein ligase A